jgi:MFS transporter, CP family, cyanate transporter
MTVAGNGDLWRRQTASQRQNRESAQERMIESEQRGQPGLAPVVSGVGIGLFVMWLAALNLRTGLIGVGPILSRLTDDLGLSQTQGSFLVALPTALMGLAAIPGGRLADRFGSRRLLTVSLFMVAIAGGLRAVAPGYLVLIVLTILFGAAIGIAQPALPRLGRALIPTRVGFATGVYAGGFFAGSVLAAFLTGPVLLPLSPNDSWRFPLAVWGALGLIGAMVWVTSLSRWRVNEIFARARSSEPATRTSWTPWRDRPSWVVAGVFAGQGLAYYLLVAWLPSVYEQEGISDATAGGLFAVFNLATFPAMVGLPILSDRIGSRRIPTFAASAIFLVGALGLSFAPVSAYWIWLWPLLAGFGVAGVFGMGLLMPADVAPPGATGVAAGMVLGVGYLGSALGPVIGGLVRDVTGSFEAALTMLPLLALAMMALAIGSPQPNSRKAG